MNKKDKQEAWKQIIEKRSQMLILKREIDMLKEKAVRELRELGYSHGNICGILGIGKVNSIKFSRESGENDILPHPKKVFDSSDKTLLELAKGIEKDSEIRRKNLIFL